MDSVFTTEALEVFAREGAHSLLDHLSRNGDPWQVLQAYAEIVHALYWNHKNLPAVTTVATAGIQYALALARGGALADEEQRLRALAAAKKLAYNLGSFTWRGWDEPGVQVDASLERIGCDAARLNMALTREFPAGTFQIHRAQWLLAAHFLSAGLWEQAILLFETSAAEAEADGKTAESWLARAYALLTQQVERQTWDQPAQWGPEWASSLEQLGRQDDGAFYVAQVETAARVFLEQ